MSLYSKAGSMVLRQAARSLRTPLCHQPALLAHSSSKYPCRTLATIQNNFYSPIQIRYSAFTPVRRCSTKATEGEQAKAEHEQHAPEEQNPPEVSEEQKKIEALTEELKELEGKYKRTLADRENIRLRLQKQVEDSKIYAIQGFSKDLLEVSDVFRKAIESVSPEQAAESEQLQKLYDGLTMTEALFHTKCSKNGLAKLSPAVGDKFDPKFHESMFQVPASAEQTPGTVAHVMRDGWSLHERCIRSAQVGVFSG